MIPINDSELSKLALDMTLTNVIRSIYLFVALLAGFIAFPDYKLFVASVLLFLSRSLSTTASLLNYWSVRQRRLTWIFALTNQKAIFAMQSAIANQKQVELNETQWKQYLEESERQIQGHGRDAFALESFERQLPETPKSTLWWSVIGLLIWEIGIVAAAWAIALAFHT